MRFAGPSASSRAPITPDYIRVGSRFCMVTWPRLAGLSVLLFLAALFFGPASTPPLDAPAAPAPHETTGAVLRRAAGAVVGRLKTLAGGAVDERRRGGRKFLTGIMRPWCAVAAAGATVGASAAWRPAALGTAPWPAQEADKEYCDWAEKTTTQVSFRVCTFARDKDTQVSAYIHKEGHWSGWKKQLAEEFLPLLDSAAAWRAVEGRTLVLDVRSSWHCWGGGLFCSPAPLNLLTHTHAPTSLP